MPFIDISLPLRSSLPVWPGDPSLEITALSDMAKGDENNVTHLSFCVHTGTHVDAPSHFIRGEKSVEALSLDALIGPVTVLECDDSIDAITPKVLDDVGFVPGMKRVLFKTKNSRLWAPDKPCTFFKDFVAFTPDAASVLADAGVLLAGIDYLSVQRYADKTPETHVRFLEKGVILLEGLDLRNAPAGQAELICLPLNIEGADGAPARAVLKI